MRDKNDVSHTHTHTYREEHTMKTVYVVCIGEEHTSEYLFICETEETAKDKIQSHKSVFPDDNLFIYEEELY